MSSSRGNNVINSKDSFKYSTDFLDEIVSNLIKLKSIHLSKPKNSTFVIETKKLLGKATDIFSNEIEKNNEKITSISDDEFSKKIKKKFEEKKLETEDCN